MTSFVVSGASGTIGIPLIGDLLTRSQVDTTIHAVCRNKRGAAVIQNRYPIDDVRPVIVDLCGRDAALALGQQLPTSEPCVGIHCAADVSWHKTYNQLAPINVEGTLAFARAIASTHPDSQIINVSTAYTSRGASQFKNDYERTKSTADIQLRRLFPDISSTTFSCSLVVGSSTDGAISRFNGVYPMLRAMALYNPPVIIGDPKTRIDLVPVDWVAAELALVSIGVSKAPLPDVMASAGEQAGTLGDLMGAAEDRIASFRNGLGYEYNWPTPIISRRRNDFLSRAASTWHIPADLASQMRFMQRLQNRQTEYSRYMEGSRAATPANVTQPAPNIESYVNVVMDFWLTTERESMSRSLARQQRWRTATTSANER